MQERVLARWTKLIQGLRIRRRLQNQYINDVPGMHGTDNREVS